MEIGPDAWLGDWKNQNEIRDEECPAEHLGAGKKRLKHCGSQWRVSELPRTYQAVSQWQEEVCAGTGTGKH